jgi:hypothetical protein
VVAGEDDAICEDDRENLPQKRHSAVVREKDRTRLFRILQRFAMFELFCSLKWETLLLTEMNLGMSDDLERTLTLLGVFSVIHWIKAFAVRAPELYSTGGSLPPRGYI